MQSAEEISKLFAVTTLGYRKCAAWLDSLWWNPQMDSRVRHHYRNWICDGQKGFEKSQHNIAVCVGQRSWKKLKLRSWKRISLRTVTFKKCHLRTNYALWWCCLDHHRSLLCLRWASTLSDHRVASVQQAASSQKNKRLQSFRELLRYWNVLGCCWSTRLWTVVLSQVQ